MNTTKEAKPESKAAAKRREKAEAIARLRAIFPPGSTVCTIMRSVSASGMYRHISVIAIRGGVPENVSGDVADALGYRWHDDGSVGAGGCGMDMGFHITQSLSYVLHPDGFDCLGPGCPSNDHSNRDEHVPGGGKGYSLRHRWL